MQSANTLIARLLSINKKIIFLTLNPFKLQEQLAELGMKISSA
jgi:hypothetical protein